MHPQFGPRLLRHQPRLAIQDTQATMPTEDVLVERLHLLLVFILVLCAVLWNQTAIVKQYWATLIKNQTAITNHDLRTKEVNMLFLT